MTNVYGYTLQEYCVIQIYRIMKNLSLLGVPANHVGGCSEQKSTVTTASGSVRCGKHAIGTPNDGTAFVMNSKCTGWKHCYTLTLTNSFETESARLRIFFFRLPTDEKHKTKLPGCKRHSPAPCSIHTAGNTATGVVHRVIRPGHFFLDGGRNIPQDSTKAL